MLTDGGGAMTNAYAVAPFGEDVQQQGDSDQPFVYHGALGVMWERGTSLYPEFPIWNSDSNMVLALFS